MDFFLLVFFFFFLSVVRSIHGKFNVLVNVSFRIFLCRLLPVTFCNFKSRPYCHFNTKCWTCVYFSQLHWWEHSFHIYMWSLAQVYQSIYLGADLCPDCPNSCQHIFWHRWAAVKKQMKCDEIPLLTEVPVFVWLFFVLFFCCFGCFFFLALASNVCNFEHEIV